MKTQITIESEWMRRESLVQDYDFRLRCAKIAEAMGITEQEWNANKAIICLMMANEVCSIENKMNK